jgi:sulfoacetaldehyde dehydrogenase
VKRAPRTPAISARRSGGEDDHVRAGAETDPIADVIARGRAAQRIAAEWDQARVDDTVAAVAWHLYEPSAARELTDLAFDETGLGNRSDLYELHRRRVLGALHDLHGVCSVGLIDDDIKRGVTTYARPMGVICVLTPATAPSSGIATNVLQILKTRNAAVVSPNPRARAVGAATVHAVRRGLAAAGAPEDLVQWLDPASRSTSQRLMEAADLVIAAGGPGSVRRAYRSGTPALSAGAGNPTAIVDETADLDQAARLIVYGVGFNHGTSCSSESNVLVHESAQRQFEKLLAEHGAYLCDERETRALADVIWTADGTLNRQMIGRSHSELAQAAGIQLPAGAMTSALAMAGRPDMDPDSVVFGEKLSPVFTLSAFADFEEAARIAAHQISRGGRGHSCGLHTRLPERSSMLAERLEVCRVMVNQSTAVGNSGAFDNGMPFTAVISTGSWGGCSQSENITWRHLINVVSVSRTIEPRVPDERALFGRHATGSRRTAADDSA